MYTADIIIYKNGKTIHTVRGLGPTRYRFELEAEIRKIGSLFESCDLEEDGDDPTCFMCNNPTCPECGYCKFCNECECSH